MTESPNDRLKRARELAGFKSAAGFAAAHDFPESTYRSIENGTRSLTMAAAKQYAPKLGCSWAWLMDGGTVGGPGSEKINPVTNVALRSPYGALTHPGSATKDGTQETFLKVLGMAEGGEDGWNLFGGEEIGSIRRPDNLIGVAGAYAVYVFGKSMEPRYQAGELVHVNPHKPVTPGAFVLVQKKPKADGDPTHAIVKRLVKRSGNRVILAQLTPAKEFELKADEIVMHRVVGSSED